MVLVLRAALALRLTSCDGGGAAATVRPLVLPESARACSAEGVVAGWRRGTRDDG